MPVELHCITPVLGTMAGGGSVCVCGGGDLQGHILKVKFPGAAEPLRCGVILETTQVQTKIPKRREPGTPDMPVSIHQIQGKV